jgi:hypothetical protein
MELTLKSLVKFVRKTLHYHKKKKKPHAVRHVDVGHPRGKLLATCQWWRGCSVVDQGVAKCTFRNVATLSTLPLGQVAYWPRRDTWTTWINHVADVSAMWPKPTWHSGHLPESHLAIWPRSQLATSLNHLATCSSRPRGEMHKFL